MSTEQKPKPVVSKKTKHDLSEPKDKVENPGVNIESKEPVQKITPEPAVSKPVSENKTVEKKHTQDNLDFEEAIEETKEKLHDAAVSTEKSMGRLKRWFKKIFK